MNLAEQSIVIVVELNTHLELQPCTSVVTDRIQTIGVWILSLGQRASAKSSPAVAVNGT